MLLLYKNLRKLQRGKRVTGNGAGRTFAQDGFDARTGMREGWNHPLSRRRKAREDRERERKITPRTARERKRE